MTEPRIKTEYVCVDGTKFTDEEKAREHDGKLRFLDALAQTSTYRGLHEQYQQWYRDILFQQADELFYLMRDNLYNLRAFVGDQYQDREPEDDE